MNTDRLIPRNISFVSHFHKIIYHIFSMKKCVQGRDKNLQQWFICVQVLIEDPVLQS